MTTSETRLCAHLARAQFDTRWACDIARDPRLTEIEQACMDDVAGLYTQIEERYLAALTEIDGLARGRMGKVARSLRVIPIGTLPESVA